MSSMCSLVVGVIETTKGRGKKKKKLASGPQADDNPDRLQSTIAAGGGRGGCRLQTRACLQVL